jgi:hypothetical protein
MGRPPKTDPRRPYRGFAQSVELPAEGRAGDPPEWPLSAATEAEERIWRALWATPMAVAWQKLGWTRTVARLAHMMAMAEEISPPRAALLAELRQLEDRLGLTPVSLLRLRWSIAAPTERASITPITEAPRRRLNLAEDGEE